MRDVNITRLAGIVREALELSPLGAVTEYRDRVAVGLPTIYPGGSNVAVEVTFAGGPDRFNVSDMAQGYQGAEYGDVQAAYAKRAADLVAEAGLEFDGYHVRARGVKAEELPGVIIWIGYCSAGALLLATRA